MLRLLQSLCVVMLITSCAEDDPVLLDIHAGGAIALTKEPYFPVTTTTSTTTTTTTTTTATTTTTTTTVKPVFWDNVERWRSIVTESVYAWGGNDDDVHRFLRIMQCESAGLPDAKNPNSSASGLMQHLTRFWPDRAARAGLPNANVFDPYANIYVSAWLALEAAEGGWHHWLCK